MVWRIINTLNSNNFYKNLKWQTILNIFNAMFIVRSQHNPRLTHIKVANQLVAHWKISARSAFILVSISFNYKEEQKIELASAFFLDLIEYYRQCHFRLYFSTWEIYLVRWVFIYILRNLALAIPLWTIIKFQRL